MCVRDRYLQTWLYAHLTVLGKYASCCAQTRLQLCAALSVSRPLSSESDESTKQILNK